MTLKLQNRDYEFIRQLAKYRMLSVSQLAAVLQRSEQVIRRRCRELKRNAVIRVNDKLGQNTGRPKSLFALTEHGIDLLRDQGLIGRDVPYENAGPVSQRLIDHQLLMNWFKIHLNEIDKMEPRPTLKFWAYNSLFVPRRADGTILTNDVAPIGQRAVHKVKFTPDAVFTITNTGGDITLLSFLEVDCGTETLASPKRTLSDIRQKILNYQWYFDTLQYKRYEEIFNVPLIHGFRVLFLTKTTGRLAALCQLTREMAPADFIWLTEQQRLFAQGALAKIWARGGNLEGARQSILGRKHCQTPLPQR